MATLAPESALRSLLLARHNSSGDLTSSIYPSGDVPETVTLPYGAYTRISTTRDPVLNAASGIVSARIQIDWRTTSFSYLRTMANAARLALDGYRGTVTIGTDTLTILSVRLEDEDDAALVPESGQEKRTLGHRQDWIVWYRESVPTFS